MIASKLAPGAVRVGLQLVRERARIESEPILVDEHLASETGGAITGIDPETERIGVMRAASCP